MTEQKTKQIKNYVYKTMNHMQAAAETRRLLQLATRGGKDTRDAIQGIIVLANIGFVSAVHAMSDLVRNGYDRIIDEVISIL